MKKSIITIIPANAAAITDAIAAAQGRATARTIDADDIIRACARIERELSISKRALDGVRFGADLNAQKFPAAYRGAPESTHFIAEYRRGAWRLVSVARGPVRSPSRAFSIQHTDVSRAAIVERLTAFGR